MTAFSPSNVPSSVTTLEELHAWSGAILAELYPSAQIQTDAATIENAVTSSPFRFANESTNKERMVTLVYIPLKADWRGKGRIWAEGVDEFGSTAIPAHYLS